MTVLRRLGCKGSEDFAVTFISLPPIYDRQALSDKSPACFDGGVGFNYAHCGIILLPSLGKS